MRALLLAVTTVLAIHAEEARACTCVNTRGLETTFPLDGAALVPLDARLWLFSDVNGADPLATLLVTGPTGDVAGTWTRLNWQPNAGPFLFSPEALLEADSEYRLQVFSEPVDVLRDEGIAESDLEQFVVRSARFTTGASDARVSPTAVPSAALLELSVAPTGGTCDSRLVDSRVTAEFELLHEGLVFVADIDGAAQLNETSLVGSVSSFGGASQATFGTTLCAHPWPSVASGSTSTFRFGAVDAAGRFSGWSDAQDVSVPDFSPAAPPPDEQETAPPLEQAAGCAAVDAAFAAPALALLCVLTFHRRLRRKTPC